MIILKMCCSVNQIDDLQSSNKKQSWTVCLPLLHLLNEISCFSGYHQISSRIPGGKTHMAMDFFKNCVTNFSSRIPVGKKPDGNGTLGEFRQNFFCKNSYQKKTELQQKFLYEKLFGCPRPSHQKFLTFHMMNSYNTINISRKQILSASDKNMYSVSAYFHSINPGFDAEVAKKFLNGIQYTTFKTDIIKVVLDFQISNFFNNKNSQGRKLSAVQLQ